MDGKQFDQWTQVFARDASRRRLIHFFLAGGVSGLSTLIAEPRSAARRNKRPPETPTGVQATALDNSRIQITWEDVFTESGYRIYNEGLVLASLPADVTTFIVEGLVPNATYCYRVQAYKGKLNSFQTDPVCATTKALGRAGLKAPVRKGLSLTVIHGYNDPIEANLPDCTPGEVCNNQGTRTCDVFGGCCPINTPNDHCGHQRYALDLQPGDGWGGVIIAPASGKVGWSGGECLGLTLEDGTNLTICHFGENDKWVSQGDQVVQGQCLGRKKTGKNWIHLNLDDGKIHFRRGPSHPIPFVSGNPKFPNGLSLEGKNFTPNDSQDQFERVTITSSNDCLNGCCFGTSTTTTSPPRALSSGKTADKRRRRVQKKS